MCNFMRRKDKSIKISTQNEEKLIKARKEAQHLMEKNYTMSWTEKNRLYSREKDEWIDVSPETFQMYLAILTGIGLEL